MNPKFFILVLGSIVAGLPISTSSNAAIHTTPNLLRNGGFNLQGFPYPNDLSLIFEPWQFSGSIAYSWANDSATIGTGVSLDAGGIVGFGSGSIYQDVATTLGQPYELTIIAHARGNASETSLQPLWNGVSLPLGFAPYFEWTAIRYEVQATDTITRLTITATPNNQGPIWIDSVALVAIPEPSVLVLFTLAGSFVLLRANRARAPEASNQTAPRHVSAA